MKSYLLVFFFAFMFQKCKKVEIAPLSNNSLVGKWNYGYKIQNKTADGNWSQWTTINTLVAVPVSEFTADRKILYDGKIVKECCTYSSYTVTGNSILANRDISGLDCSTLKCALVPEWIIYTLDSELLEIELPYQRIRYFRMK